MSEHKHTPGPWKAVKSSWDDSWSVDTENDTVCFLSYLREEDHWTVNLDNDEANARLIAAAPALLEALEAVEWESDGYGKMYCPACDNYRTYGHKSDCKLGNALKQVRGEE